MSQLSQLLQAQPAFADLSQDDLDALVMAFSVLTFPPGHVFFHERDPGDAVFLILEGQVEVSARAPFPGAFQVTKQLGPGDLFGLLAILDGQPRSATCRGMDRPVRAAMLPANAAGVLSVTHAPLAYAFQRAVATQLARDAGSLFGALLDAAEETLEGSPPGGA